jgi:hypothetical protein
MKKHLILLFAVLPWLASCQWGVPHSTKPAVTKDTLVYTYKKIEERAPDCGNKPDTACSSAKITYPVFKEQNLLNTAVTDSLAFSLDKKPDGDLGQQAKDFIQAYMNDKKHKANPDLVYTLESNASVIRQDSSLVTVQIDRYIETGQTHGSSHTSFLNWNSKANREIQLDSIFIPGYKGPLTSVAEKIFRSEEKLGPTSSLKNYSFKDGKFALNNNFLITPVGIRFLYNEGEIKPYADGQTELLIPYAQIKSLLRPGTVVNQYSK